jgi:hypothetical protein
MCNVKYIRNFNVELFILIMKDVILDSVIILTYLIW